ncbi:MULTISPECIES: glycosyl hydrolase [unclassified Imperialibacter]|uniref:glycosyl hydrolase n=1 Tax=unclassified Imperialibacter TaxID=2629706 RepID=UPI00125B2F8F|nr:MULTISPECIES: glycosyl hydrolase [unclassified Imperialibacter]CAD5282412.1 conserved exported hypothetical protein [Imperialibacter sp. 75]CAD5291863.1 conserved exported hypothetical protein [Imperialibacter sp. 89]VVT28096.1 Mannan endo-1,4-beta-mannosidase (modular protein) [Imperialibacter sp. EC-SDR9]
MKLIPLALLCLGLSIYCSRALCQVDPDASDKTFYLYDNLRRVQASNQFLFGQEFFNSFSYASGSADGDKESSDSKDVTGTHPAVLGSDFHYYLEKSEGERRYHTEAVKWAYQQGYVITYDWHLSARGTSSYEYKDDVKDLVSNIVDDLNGDRDWYLGELDKVIDIINNELVVDGENIPIVFRPLHEMNGGWFWWGSKATTPQTYKTLYRLTQQYIEERTNTVLFAWSPNNPVDFNYYPGDDYVDIVGVDAYEVSVSGLRNILAPIVDYSFASGKVAVFTETGNRTNGGASNGDDAARYWLDTILPAITGDPTGRSQNIAWVLTWINAAWSFPYVPYANSSDAAKASFIAFQSSSAAIFGNEMPDMYRFYDVTAVADNRSNEDVQLFPMPVTSELTIRLSGFESQSMVKIYDLRGQLVHELTTEGNEMTVHTEGLLSTGVYLLSATDSRKTVSKKVVVN